MKKSLTYLSIVALCFLIGVVMVRKWISHPMVVNEASNVTLSPKPQVHSDGDLIIKDDGWLLPDLAKCQLLRSTNRVRPALPESAIHGTHYDCNLVVPRYGFDGNLKAERQIRIENATVFNIGGRTFCYRMLATDVPMPNEAAVGVVWYETFYDLDGDGKFESRDIKYNVMKPLRTPVWAQSGN